MKCERCKQPITRKTARRNGGLCTDCMNITLQALARSHANDCRNC